MADTYEYSKEPMAIVSESLSSVELTQKEGVYSWKVKLYATSKNESTANMEARLNSIESALQHRYGKKWPAPKDVRSFLLEVSTSLTKIRKHAGKSETAATEAEIDSLRMAVNTMFSAFSGA